jgi:hypothetical protein
MARLIFREFDATQPTYARRKFIANGRRYVPGDLFDWRRLSLTERKAKQMFDGGHLMHGEVTPEPIAATPADNLDLIEDMKELRAIAAAEGAPYKVSKADQRQAIRDNRKETD